MSTIAQDRFMFFVYFILSICAGSDKKTNIIYIYAFLKTPIFKKHFMFNLEQEYNRTL